MLEKQWPPIYLLRQLNNSHTFKNSFCLQVTLRSMETNCPLSSEILLIKTWGEWTWLSNFQGQEIKLRVAMVLLIFYNKNINWYGAYLVQHEASILSFWVWQDNPAILRPFILKTLWTLFETSYCSYIKFLKCLGICVLNSVIWNMCKIQLCRHHFD